jgi:hypothetical protein
VDVGAQIVDPELSGPGGFRGGFLVEEENVGLDPLSIKQAGGQAQQGVDVAIVQEFAAHGLAGPAFKEDIIRHHEVV